MFSSSKCVHKKKEDTEFIKLEMEETAPRAPVEGANMVPQAKYNCFIVTV